MKRNEYKSPVCAKGHQYSHEPEFGTSKHYGKTLEN